MTGIFHRIISCCFFFSLNKQIIIVQKSSCDHISLKRNDRNRSLINKLSVIFPFVLNCLISCFSIERWTLAFGYTVKTTRYLQRKNHHRITSDFGNSMNMKSRLTWRTMEDDIWMSFGMSRWRSLIESLPRMVFSISFHLRQFEAKLIDWLIFLMW